MTTAMAERAGSLTTQEAYEDDSIHYWIGTGRGAITYSHSKATLLIEARSALIDLMNGYEDDDPVRVEAQLVVNDINEELTKRAGYQARELMEPIEACFGDIRRYLEDELFNDARNALLKDPMPKMRVQLCSGASRPHVQAAIARISGKKFGDYLKKVDDACAAMAQEINDQERAARAAAQERMLMRAQEQRGRMMAAARALVKQSTIDETKDLIGRVERSIETGDRRQAGAMLANLRSKSKYGDAIRAIHGEEPIKFLDKLQQQVNAMKAV